MLGMLLLSRLLGHCLNGGNEFFFHLTLWPNLLALVGIGLKSLITEFPEEGKYSMVMDKSNNFSALIILCLKEELVPQGG